MFKIGDKISDNNGCIIEILDDLIHKEVRCFTIMSSCKSATFLGSISEMELLRKKQKQRKQKLKKILQ